METAKALALIEQERRGRALVSGPLSQFIASSPGYVAPLHLQPILEKLERLDQEPLREAFHAPPRHGKTEAVLHSVVYWLRRRPSMRWAYVSYAKKIAQDKIAPYQTVASRCGLRLIRCNLSSWVTSQRGGLEAMGVGGAITGYGFDGIVIDDPIRNLAEAESKLAREKMWDWFRWVLRTRCQPGASIILLMARWNEDDLVGKVTKELGYHYTCLPAIEETTLPDGTIYAKPLWPGMWPLATLKEIEHDVGEFGWAALFQGHPVSRGNCMYKGTTLYEKLPATYRLVIGVDTAYTEDSRADWSVAVVLAHDGQRGYVVDVLRMKAEAPAFGARLKVLWGAHGKPKMYWYASGTEKGTAAYMKAMHGLPLTALPAVTSKLQRSQYSAGAWNAGDILVPKEAPWLDEFLNVVLAFKGVGKEVDDDVDALAAAWNPFETAGRYWAQWMDHSKRPDAKPVPAKTVAVVEGGVQIMKPKGA